MEKVKNIGTINALNGVLRDLNKANKKLNELEIELSKKFDWIDEPIKIILSNEVIYVLAKRKGKEFAISIERYVELFEECEMVDVEAFVKEAKANSKK